MVFRVLALALLASTATAAELEGVQLEDRVRVDGQALELNGIAVRTRVFFKVYVAGLYLPQKVTSAQTAIESPGAKRIVLVMLRDASAEQFCDSVQAGIDANHNDISRPVRRKSGWEALKIAGDHLAIGTEQTGDFCALRILLQSVFDFRQPLLRCIRSENAQLLGKQKVVFVHHVDGCLQIDEAEQHQGAKDERAGNGKRPAERR